MTSTDARTPVPQLTAPPADTPATLTAPSVDAHGTRHFREVIYANVIGHRPLAMDLLIPAGTAPVPVVLWFHGGGFLLGSRRRSGLSGPPWDALLARGIAVAAVQYRFALEAPFPACVNDVKAAVRWLRRHGGELGLAPDAIGSWGESAGGYLSIFLALGGDEPLLEGDVDDAGTSTRVQAAVSWYGPTDFLAMDTQSAHASFGPHDAPGSPESLLIGGPLQENVDRAAAASPITYARSMTPAPLLLVHGLEDPHVPHQQSATLARTLAQEGAEIRLELIPGAGHMFDGVAMDPMIDASVEFLAARLF